VVETTKGAESPTAADLSARLPALPDPAPARPAAPKPPKEPEGAKGDFNSLNLEVTALEMLYQFRITRSQLEQLAKLAPRTARPMPAAREVTVSADFARTLKDLRAALVAHEDDDIADLSARLDKLRAAESPEFDEVEIGDGARKHTPGLLRQLSARQVASYLADFADEFPDPLEKVLDAFDDVRKLPAKEWEPLRDEVAGQVGWLVAGLDAAAEEKVAKQVAELLNRVRGLGDEEFKAKRAELEKSAERLAGQAGPTEVIRHFVERSLAELLSNPRLAAAVEARLKNGE
jgi:hypothetical protein